MREPRTFLLGTVIACVATIALVGAVWAILTVAQKIDSWRGYPLCDHFEVRIEFGHPGDEIEAMRIRANHRFDVAQRKCARGVAQ